MSRATSPAKANATTRGGDARKASSTCACTRPGKLRLPDSTATGVIGLLAIALAIALAMGGASGPELPMQVVQP